MPGYNLSFTALLHMARAGMMAHQTGLDQIANNIANLNTTGYKHSRTEFQELLNAQLQPPKANSNRLPAQAAGTLLVATQGMFEQGQIQASQQPWDMAIEGNGFFQIQRGDGSLAYTRDGSFRLDGEGHLVKADGSFLSPPITIPPDAQETFVNLDGSIMVRRQNETAPQVVGTISLVHFANPAGLTRVGNNLFQPTDVSGQPEVGQPGTSGLGKIMAHALEDSNVDLSQEMVGLISAQRAYTLMVRALETSNEMLGMAAQLRS